MLVIKEFVNQQLVTNLSYLYRQKIKRLILRKTIQILFYEDKLFRPNTNICDENNILPK